MDINYDKHGDFTISGNLYELGVEDVMQPWLVEAARIIEDLKDPNDVELWEAMMIVIPYFSNPDQIKELKEYQADQEWINIVFNHNASK